MNNLLAIFTPTHACRHGDIAIFSAHRNITVGTDSRAIIVDIAIGGRHAHIATRGNTGVHTVTDVINIAVRDQRHVAARRN